MDRCKWFAARWRLMALTYHSSGSINQIRMLQGYLIETFEDALTRPLSHNH